MARGFPVTVARRRYGTKLGRVVVLLSLLVGVQVGLVRQVQWVRRELTLLEEARSARRQAAAETHRLERALVSECRPDAIARRARQLGLRSTRPDELLFLRARGSPTCTGVLPPCITEVLDAASLGAE